MRTKKTLLVLALAFISYQVNAQFKDSSWLMMHDVSLGYQRLSTVDTFNGGGSLGLNPSLGVKYIASIGKFKKRILFFYGVQFLFEESKVLGKISKEGTGITKIAGGVHGGVKKFIPLFDKFYINPTAIIIVDVGKENRWRSDGIASLPQDFYSINLFETAVRFQPLRIGYKFSKSGLLEINFFETQIGYTRKKGSREVAGSNIEVTDIYVKNNFLQAINITFSHILNSKK
ncbi:MAG: hypothetical protein K2Q24_17025 [Chitinophagaceae bacterium]|jgi:hypothetical protein|nr:hypothetical protein [Chitinophagaceae bacterium]